jgi:hypothetical protein
MTSSRVAPARQIYSECTALRWNRCGNGFARTTRPRWQDRAAMENIAFKFDGHIRAQLTVRKSAGLDVHGQQVASGQACLPADDPQVLPFPTHCAARQPRDWLAVDDDVIGWPEAHLHRLVQSDPCEGISAPAVLEELKKKLAAIVRPQLGIGRPAAEAPSRASAASPTSQQARSRRARYRRRWSSSPLRASQRRRRETSRIPSPPKRR